MFKILVNSAEPYVDGTLTPKIKANVSAFYWDDTMLETTLVDDKLRINDGQLLVNLDVAFDVSSVVEVLSEQTDPEEKKQALNRFVIALARRDSLLSIENLKEIKLRLDAESQALLVCNNVLSALEPLVIWPARIPYPED